MVRGVQTILDHPVILALAPGPDAQAVAGPAALEVRVAPADLELVRGLGGGVGRDDAVTAALLPPLAGVSLLLKGGRRDTSL